MRMTYAVLLALNALAVPLLGASSTLAKPLAPTQNEAAVGYLTVTSEPAARIVIDENDTGLMTPQTRLPLPPGRHKLILVGEGQKKKSLGFVITKGEETRLRVNL